MKRPTPPPNVRIPLVGDWVTTNYGTGPYLVIATMRVRTRYNPIDPMDDIVLPPHAVDISLSLRDATGKGGFGINAVRIKNGRLLASGNDELTIVPPPPDAKPYQLPMQLTTEGDDGAP